MELESLIAVSWPSQRQPPTLKSQINSCVCVYIYIYCVCVCVCVYIYIVIYLVSYFRSHFLVNVIIIKGG